MLHNACAYAQAPNHAPQTRRQEREASGVSYASFDDVITARRMVADGIVRTSTAASIVKLISVRVDQMVPPIVVAATLCGDLGEAAELYRRRIDQLIVHASSCSDDQLPNHDRLRSENGHARMAVAHRFNTIS